MLTNHVMFPRFLEVRLVEDASRKQAYVNRCIPLLITNFSRLSPGLTTADSREMGAEAVDFTISYTAEDLTGKL